MSLLVTYQAVCDFCKKELEREEYELACVPGGPMPIPGRLIMQRFVYLGEKKLVLCVDCMAPSLEALHARIAKVRGDSE